MKKTYMRMLAAGGLAVALGLVGAAARAQHEHHGRPGQHGQPSTKAPVARPGTVRVTEKGFHPATVTVKAGKPVTLTFLRTSDKGCGTEVLFTDYKIKKALPLNKPVTVSFTPKKAGAIAFTCGMKMMKGKVVAR